MMMMMMMKINTTMMIIMMTMITMVNNIYERKSEGFQSGFYGIVIML